MSKIKLVTHSGRFHSDDAFATAVLSLLFEARGQEFELIRSRDPKDHEQGDILYDTGNKYSPEEKIFDHHQEGGAGVRENGVPYAAFGLIWKHYGKELIKEYFKDEEIGENDIEEIYQLIDKGFVQPSDAKDTGYEDYKSNKNDDLQTYVMDTAAKSFNPTNEEGYKKTFELFMDFVEIAKKILERELIRANSKLIGFKKVEEVYNNADDKRIIVLEEGMSWREILVSKPEPLFVIFPTIDNDGFMIQAVNKGLSGYEVRKSFPQSWRGKINEELAKETGIAGSKFCHSAGFLCVTKTKEEAIELAKIAVEA